MSEVWSIPKAQVKRTREIKNVEMESIGGNSTHIFVTSRDLTQPVRFVSLHDDNGDSDFLDPVPSLGAYRLTTSTFGRGATLVDGDLVVRVINCENADDKLKYWRPQRGGMEAKRSGGGRLDIVTVIDVWSISSRRHFQRIMFDGTFHHPAHQLHGDRLVIADGTGKLQVWDVRRGVLDGVIDVKSDRVGNNYPKYAYSRDGGRREESPFIVTLIDFNFSTLVVTYKSENHQGTVASGVVEYNFASGKEYIQSIRALAGPDAEARAINRITR
jgi:hypothetical protein